MNKLNINSSSIEELTFIELKAINGGDKFTKDLGNAVGSLCANVMDFLSDVGDYMQNNDYWYRSFTH